jgi:metal-dependent amidase/aminoacylase/carboxypeptidase family protein
MSHDTSILPSRERGIWILHGELEVQGNIYREGINALDAAVLAYNGTSMLRQQIKPDQRIQGVLLEGGERANIITPKSVLDYNVRGSTLEETKELQKRVVKCFEGAAIATGCSVEFLE